MIMSIFKGLIFHYDEIVNATSALEIKNLNGQLQVEYKSIEEYQDVWLQYLLTDFHSHLTKDSQRFNQNLVPQLEAELNF